MMLDHDEGRRTSSASCSTQARGRPRRPRRQLEEAGCDVDGDIVTDEPIAALAAKVRNGAAEVIVLTRSHVVAEFFHVDWTSRARRKLGVPVLHLLEHENFDEQAGENGGEGVTGL